MRHDMQAVALPSCLLKIVALSQIWDQLLTVAAFSYVFLTDF